MTHLGELIEPLLLVKSDAGEINSKLDPIQFLLLQSSLLLQQTNTISAGQIQKCVNAFLGKKSSHYHGSLPCIVGPKPNFSPRK